MSVVLQKGHPASSVLLAEGIEVLDRGGEDALKVLILNLMPTKEVTEVQLARLLGACDRKVHITWLRTQSHESTHAAPGYMETFYSVFSQVEDRYFDGFIITGAPVEHLAFQEVDYWQELCRVMEWSKTHVKSTLYICWGAQAGLYYHYGIPKHPLPEKLFGVYTHTVQKPDCPLFAGFPAQYPVPHSRHTTVLLKDVEKCPQITVLSSSQDAGLYAMMANDGREVYLTGHIEYDADTLELEYLRDKSRGLPIHVPVHYYPQDDDTQRPVLSWRDGAKKLFANWVEFYL